MSKRRTLTAEQLRQLRLRPVDGPRATAATPRPRMRGLGDLVAWAIQTITFGRVTPCGKCRRRKRRLNRWFPFGGRRRA